ncbi:MAG: hypothetical protein GC155_09055 [Alphaproteobacteria bacterium]|nr:hypothetical protein [Alphaproteobacteria bacterium]
MRPQWFGPKRFGVGVGPRSWEGWAVIAVLVAVAIGVKWLSLPPGWAPGIRIACLPVLAAIVALTYREDEPHSKT